MEDPQPSGIHCGGGFKGIDAPARSFTADQADGRIIDEVIEGTDRVGAECPGR